MNRFLKKSLESLLIAALLAAAPIAASAATFTVNSNNDVDDATCDGTHCSLREAINAANAAAGADEIVFDSDLDGETILLSGALPTVEDDLTVTGPGANLLTIDGDNDNYLFWVDSEGDGITVSLSGLYLYDGIQEGAALLYIASADTVAATDVVFASGYTIFGAVYNSGTFTATNSDFISNAADEAGGALYNDGGTVTLAGGSFRNNAVYCGDGGAIYNSGGDITITGTLFDRNTVTEDCTEGGAVYSDGGSLTITGATFTHNFSYDGGGGAIAAYDTDLVIEDSTFSGNIADGGGGALLIVGGEAAITSSVFNQNEASGGAGGAIYAVEVAGLTVTDSTVSGNYAFYSGGGIGSYDDSVVTLVNTVIENNFSEGCCSGAGIYMITTGGSLTIEGGAVSGNEAGYGNGGGIEFYGYGDASLEITGAVVSNNIAENGSGGGIYAYLSGTGSTFTLSQSTISGNTAQDAGGVYVTNVETALIERSSIVDNLAYYSAGGLRADVNDGTLVNSTVSGNATYGAGGGVYVEGNLDILHSTITNNAADIGANGGNPGGGIFEDEATVTLTSSIVSGNFNFSPGGGDPDISGTITSGGTNLIGDDTGASGLDESDIVGLDPLLGPLVSLPGVPGTSVHPLLLDSPARAAADSESCPETDQIGLIRNPAACDIGAMRYITIPGITGGVFGGSSGGCSLDPSARSPLGSQTGLLLLAVGTAFFFERRRRARARS